MDKPIDLDAWRQRRVGAAAFVFMLSPDTGVLGELRHALQAWLKGQAVTESDRMDIVLATHEAAANAIEHADASELVQVDAARMNGLVTIDVQDRGRWKPEPSSVDRGRGLRLIENSSTYLRSTSKRTVRACG